MSRRPSSSTGMNFSTTPLRSRRKCHGTMLAWCSISDSTISSPAFRLRPNELATKFTASVALLVQTTSSRSALMNFATVSRAFS
jgi:hypothetical protein